MVALQPLTAHAYLDPGTGSYLLQLLIAGIAGGLYAAKVYWRQLKVRFFSRAEKDERHGRDGGR